MHRIVDLSHTFASDMPVYPGTEPPVIRPANTLERNGFAETSLAMYSHAGTHVDAPSHMLAGAPSLDCLDVGHFVGEGCLVDATGCTGTIQVDTLRASEAAQGRGCGDTGRGPDVVERGAGAKRRRLERIVRPRTHYCSFRGSMQAGLRLYRM